MKLTKKLCKLVEIHNGYVYAMGRPYVYYSPQQLGRDSRPSSWYFSDPKHKFDSHWMDYGRKGFMVLGKKDKEEKRLEAIAFAQSWMKTDEPFVKTPFGDYMPKSFVDKRNLEIINLIKEIKNANSTV